MRMTVKTDHNVVGCAVGWYAVPMQRLCAGGKVDHTRQPSTTSNRSWRQGGLPEVRRAIHSAKHAVGVQVVLLCLAACGLLTTPAEAQTPAAVPVFQITPGESTIQFAVKASVAIEGTFDQWEASLTFTSPAAESAVLNVKIQAASVNTGSGLKDSTLKSDDFFNVEQDPLITFRSTSIVQTGPETFDVPGTFTIRGVSKPETLHLTLSGKGTGSGTITGTMAFDRKDYGMTSGIPFIRIADRVEVRINLKGTRVSGPPVVFKQ